jgi:GHMP kinase-like protein
VRGRAVSDEAADGLGEAPSTPRAGAESARPGTAVARVPATCGELLQGVDDQGPVLVSLPVERGGTVEVALVDAPGERVQPDRPRARAALRLALHACGWRGGARVRLGAEVPPGRGLGSSTIDVAGVLSATAAAAGVVLDAARLMRLATAVEPSDTSPLAGLWAADHVHGRRLRSLGPAPTAWVAAVDGGGIVDTLALTGRAAAPVHRRRARPRGDRRRPRRHRRPRHRLGPPQPAAAGPPRPRRRPRGRLPGGCRRRVRRPQRHPARGSLRVGGCRPPRRRRAARPWLAGVGRPRLRSRRHGPSGRRPGGG